ncbi:hypothetical protein FRC02_008758 [Tulasnella sp. 418]|nr:hypothetical protein FRC02_008758 [Tulasnella sp. 418]
MDSRPASPEQQLWSSILDSVSSSRAIPSKNVIVLGDPSTGKSTIAAALLNKSGDKQRDNGKEEDRSAYDFAIGYQWADVRDEADEDTLARLSVYTVPSSDPAHLALLPHFVPPRTSLPNTAVVIVLDWTRPWTFIEQLYTWLAWIEKWVHGDSAREMEVAREEGRERLQSLLQHYVEPDATAETITLPSGNANLTSALLPLSQGVLTHNTAGVPIMVVCTKTDLINEEQDAPGIGNNLGIIRAKGGEWEERTDGIMQALRTICLKYGAGLFYTTTTQPLSLSQLRLYALHLLFAPPAPPPDTAPSKNIFPFTIRPNVLDRDRIVIPAGWDSWGKISVVRDGFDCSRWGEAWERGLEDDANSGGGAREMFRVLVGVTEIDKPPALPPLIVAEPEQAFLAKHYELLAKDPSRDPRQSFRQPQNPSDTGVGAGVVGPMGSSSFSLPSVEKVMVQLEGEDVGARLARMGTTRRQDTRPNPSVNPLLAAAAAIQPGQGQGPLVNGSASRLTLSTKTGIAAGGQASPSLSTTGTGGISQREVLQNFFQTLLRDKPSSAAAPPSTSTTSNPSTTTQNPSAPAATAATIPPVDAPPAAIGNSSDVESPVANSDDVE